MGKAADDPTLIYIFMGTITALWLIGLSDVIRIYLLDGYQKHRKEKPPEDLYKRASFEMIMLFSDHHWWPVRQFWRFVAAVQGLAIFVSYVISMMLVLVAYAAFFGLLTVGAGRMIAWLRQF